MFETKENMDTMNIMDIMDTDTIDRELGAIEKEISLCAQTDTSNWIRMFYLMEKVESKKLYAPKYRSFSAWVNHMSEECGMHVSTLWARKKAGSVYNEYRERCKKKGVQVAPLENIAISPDSLKLCSTVAGKNADELDSLISKTLKGDLKRSDLREAARIKKANSEHSVLTRHNMPTPVEGLEEPLKASDIVLALSSCNWLIKAIDTDYSLLHGEYVAKLYEGFSEFPIASGTSRHSRRIDYMIFENLSCRHSDDILIHGIEIKVNKQDLLSDQKMAEYKDFCDAFYIAVPDTEEMIEAAYSYIDTSWGIIAVEKNKENDFTAKVLKTPTIEHGVLREKSFVNALRKKLNRV